MIQTPLLLLLACTHCAQATDLQIRMELVQTSVDVAQKSASAPAATKYTKSEKDSGCPSGSGLIEDQSECFAAYNELKGQNGWSGGTIAGTWGHVMQCGVHLGNTKVHHKTNNVDGNSPGEPNMWVHLCKQAAAPAACTDTNDGAADPYGDDCSDYHGNANWCGKYDDPDFVSNTMCCACGGGSQAQAQSLVDSIHEAHTGWAKCKQQLGKYNGLLNPLEAKMATMRDTGNKFKAITNLVKKILKKLEPLVKLAYKIPKYGVIVKIVYKVVTAIMAIINLVAEKVSTFLAQFEQMYGTVNKHISKANVHAAYAQDLLLAINMTVASAEECSDGAPLDAFIDSRAPKIKQGLKSIDAAGKICEKLNWDQLKKFILAITRIAEFLKTFDPIFEFIKTLIQKVQEVIDGFPALPGMHAAIACLGGFANLAMCPVTDAIAFVIHTLSDKIGGLIIDTVNELLEMFLGQFTEVIPKEVLEVDVSTLLPPRKEWEPLLCGAAVLKRLRPTFYALTQVTILAMPIPLRTKIYMAATAADGGWQAWQAFSHVMDFLYEKGGVLPILDGNALADKLKDLATLEPYESVYASTCVEVWNSMTGTEGSCTEAAEDIAKFLSTEQEISPGNLIVDLFDLR